MDVNVHAIGRFLVVTGAIGLFPGALLEGFSTVPAWLVVLVGFFPVGVVSVGFALLVVSRLSWARDPEHAKNLTGCFIPVTLSLALTALLFARGFDPGLARATECMAAFSFGGVVASFGAFGYLSSSVSSDPKE